MRHFARLRTILNRWQGNKSKGNTNLVAESELQYVLGKKVDGIPGQSRNASLLVNEESWLKIGTGSRAVARTRNSEPENMMKLLYQS